MTESIHPLSLAAESFGRSVKVRSMLFSLCVRSFVRPSFVRSLIRLHVRSNPLLMGDAHKASRPAAAAGQSVLAPSSGAQQNGEAINDERHLTTPPMLINAGCTSARPPRRLSQCFFFLFCP